MLLQFKVKNYKSFKEESILDLMASRETSHEDHYLKKNDYKILKTLAIHGANACGKTTLIDAINRMGYLIVNTAMSDINDNIKIDPFIFNKKSVKEPTEFEIIICIDEYEYKYGFICDKKEIKKEWLSRRLFKYKGVEKSIFTREGNKVETSNKEITKYGDLIHSKCLLLSILGRRKEKNAFPVYNWFFELNFFADTFSNQVSKKLIKLFAEKPKLLEKYNQFLKEFDPCMDKVVIQKETDLSSNKIYRFFGIHQEITDSNYNAIPIEGESQGTIKSLNIIPFIFQKFEQGGIIFVDELDTKLHPLVYKQIVSMFYDPAINKKNAQLIFSTHATSLLNSENMRRDQIVFIEKNKKGESSLYSLSDFENVRIDSDYQKKYLSGEFGSIPFEWKC